MNGIPNPTAQHGGDRKVIFDLGRLPGKYTSRLAKRYLTTEMTLYLCMEKSHRQGSTAGSDKRENE